MSPRQRKKWSELTPARRRAIVAAATVQFVLQALALWDVRRRPADELKGSRTWWTVATFVNIVGPVAYFTLGRRPVGSDGRPPLPATRAGGPPLRETDPGRSG